MQVRANDGKGPLLFEWNPITMTIELVRKDKFYKVKLYDQAYCIQEECSKYNVKQPDSCKKKN